MKMELLKKLDGLRKKIDIMSDNYQRSIYIMNYFRILAYLKDTNQIDEKVYNQYFFSDNMEKTVSVLEKHSNKFILDLVNNNDKLIEIDSSLRDSYMTGNWNKAIFLNSIKDDDGYQIIEEFLSTFTPSVLNLYKEMKGNHFSSSVINEEITIGTCYEMIGDKYSYINIDKFNTSITKYVTIIHEFGHAYHNYLTRNQPVLSYYLITTEVMSIFFEKFFYKFLEQKYYKGVNTKNLWSWYYTNRFWQLLDLLLTSILLKNDKISEIDSELKCKTILSKEQIIDISLDLGIVTNEIPNLNLLDYIYLVGDVVSDYFLKIMDNDFNGGFKEFCNFIQEANYYTISEILDKYANDLSYTKENIKRIIEMNRSYQKKKR